jgi:opacity protein-like surface antigen
MQGFSHFYGVSGCAKLQKERDIHRYVPNHSPFQGIFCTQWGIPLSGESHDFHIDFLWLIKLINMKLHTLLLLIILSPALANAQLGLKAGLNFTNVTNVSSVNNQSSSGFNVGIFYTTPYTRVIGSKTELVFSRQGYNYETGSVSGKVNLDYIMLPTYMCINITKYFQIQVGMQFGYLMNATADSTTKIPGGISGSVSDVTSFYNRFTYSVGGGVEVHPFKGLLVGARLNIGLNNLYKMPDLTTLTAMTNTNTTPSFVPEVNIKSNLLQIYLGWRFGH